MELPDVFTFPLKVNFQHLSIHRLLFYPLIRSHLILTISEFDWTDVVSNPVLESHTYIHTNIQANKQTNKSGCICSFFLHPKAVLLVWSMLAEKALLKREAADHNLLYQHWTRLFVASQPKLKQRHNQRDWPLGLSLETVLCREHL